MLQEAESVSRSVTVDDRYRGNVSRLVAEGNAQSNCQKHGKPESPEDDLALAFEFQQPRLQ